MHLTLVVVCYAGLFEMDCVVVSKQEWIWYLIGPLLGLAAVAVAVVWLVLTYRARLLEAWETRHIHALKRRSAIHQSQYLLQHCLFQLDIEAAIEIVS